MSAVAIVTLALFCGGLPWALRRGLAEIGEVLRCNAIDCGMMTLGGAAGALCVAAADPAAAVLCASAAVSSFTDVRHGVILDAVLVTALCAILIIALTSQGLPATVLGCSATVLAMGAVFVASRGAMGLGDLKLAGVIGAALGIERGLFALAIAFVLGGTVAAALLVSRRAERGQALPFAPYLALGAATVACNAWSVAIWR